MMNAGGVIFDNLPMLFAIGSAVGLASESGIAALSAAVSVFVTNITISTVLSITPEMASQGGKYAMVVGIPTLQMGVFGGLICGILAAWCYNRFHTMQLPEFLGFFSGKRFVAIATAFLSFLMGLLLPYVWQHIQAGIDALSVIVNGDNQAASTFIFGLVERALIPLGLHHIWYPSFWYSFGDYTTQAGQVIHGDQTIWFKMLEEGVKSFSSDTYQNAGKFMQGEFPLMLFALPAACLAMYHEAHTKNKKIAAGILFSAALTCFLTGITEPVEFTFIFVAPILYVFNAIMAGLAYMTMYLLHAHIAKSFSAGFIDYLSFGILPSFNGYQTNFLSAIIIGIPMALIYYFTFRFVIRRFDVKTPGRTEVTASANDKSDSELATEIIGLLGGAQNIDSVGSCITRLRLEVAKSDAVDRDGLNGLGARGVVFVGDNGIQGAVLKKVSIIDVAKHAGVSVSTVSLVLRQKGKISEATIEKVNAAITTLGYVHNVAAANLRANTSNLIGLILRDFSDSFSIKIRQCPLPLVAVSQSLLDEKCNLVMRDNRQAANLAARYLIERGHRTIAYIGGREGCLIREQRLLGFRSAMTQNGLVWRDDYSPACSDDTQAAAMATRQLLEKNSSITALLCHSPDAMIGSISGIHQVGRTVGKDVFLTQQVALIGFEDMLHVNLTSPSFTYVSSASDETGRQAAGLIIRKLKEPDLQTQRITLSGQLIARESA
ncbi:hypothetical protein ID866_913 [Astraeus odoratus]|nr:hypothetical protein ID866_913 [Astraeus odoratus]